MSHRQQRPWDPYDATHGGSEMDLGGGGAGAEENTTEDDYFEPGSGGGSHSGALPVRRPMGSLYATTRPGAQQVNHPAPRQHPSQQQLRSSSTSEARLMYEPSQQNSGRDVYSNYQLPHPQQQQQQPPYGMSSSPPGVHHRQTPSARQQQQQVHQAPPPVAMAGYPGTYDDGIGVGPPNAQRRYESCGTSTRGRISTRRTSQHAITYF